MSEIERNPVYPLALNSGPILGIRFIHVFIPITGLSFSTCPCQDFPAKFDEIPDKYLMRQICRNQQSHCEQNLHKDGLVKSETLNKK